MDWHLLQDWIFVLGDEYGVDPLVFAIIYFGGLPFLGLSIVWLIRNRRRSRPIHFPLLSAGFWSVSAYLYLIIAGRNIPFWVYGLIVGMICYGLWTVARSGRLLRAASHQAV